MNMPTVLTIHVDPQSLSNVRVSRISAHGEEILTVGPEVAAICGFIYQALAKGTSLSTPSITDDLLEAARVVQKAGDAIREPLGQLEALVGALLAMNRRIDNIEDMLKNRVLTLEETKKWVNEVLGKALSPRQAAPRGQ